MNPSIYSENYVSEPELSFIQKTPLCYVDSYNYSDIIGMIQGIAIKNNMDFNTIQDLLNIASDSPVGMIQNEKDKKDNRNDIKDEINLNVRSSKEICNNIVLNEKFKNLVDTFVDKAGTMLLHPYRLRALPYKLILYGIGDKFDVHIDAPHSENMIMTLVVDIHTEFVRCGGELIINGQSLNLLKNILNFIQFYHDTEHEVLSVTKGYKVSLVFDIISTNIIKEDIITTYQSKFISGINNIFKNVRPEHTPKRLGFVCHYSYFIPRSHIDKQLLFKKITKYIPSVLSTLIIDYNYKFVLKGIDALINILLNRLYKNNNGILMNIANEERYIIHESMINIRKEFDVFNELYNEYEDNEDKDKNVYDCDKYEKSIIFRNENDDNTDNLHKISAKIYNIRFDIDEKFVSIKPEYLFGDIMFIYTTRQKLQYSGNSEIHLGNSSFYGNIYSNAAMIYNIPKSKRF